MAAAEYILAIDQGTTATKALLVSRNEEIIQVASITHEQIYPQAGWVEMDPDLLLHNIRETCRRVMQNRAPQTIQAVGLSNQGETVIAWDRQNGKPLYNAISWQDTRTEEQCKKLSRNIDPAKLQAKTGLLLDSYLSAAKFSWLLENVEAVQQAFVAGRLLLGNLDAWMLWHLTQDKILCTDYTTASRTLLFNIHTLDWDDDLLNIFRVPREILPRPCPSANLFSRVSPKVLSGVTAPVTASAVDQPAALFGHGCTTTGSLKITYGTGAFLLMNIGNSCTCSQHGLLTSIAAVHPDRPVQYYLDGGMYSAGASIQWLQRQGIVDNVTATSELACSIADNQGVYFVPALVGLAAPHWQRDICGAFFGLTRASTKAHLIRAVLESIAFRVVEIVQAMQQDTHLEIRKIMADGGVSSNSFLMQFQANLLGIPISVTHTPDITGLGIARLAGLTTEFPAPAFSDKNRTTGQHTTYQPEKNSKKYQAFFKRWQKAVQCALSFQQTG